MEICTIFLQTCKFSPSPLCHCLVGRCLEETNVISAAPTLHTTNIRIIFSYSNIYIHICMYIFEYIRISNTYEYMYTNIAPTLHITNIRVYIYIYIYISIHIRICNDKVPLFCRRESATPPNKNIHLLVTSIICYGLYSY